MVDALEVAPEVTQGMMGGHTMGRDSESAGRRGQVDARGQQFVEQIECGGASDGT